tara:strand:- start:52 stop:678 length:627 start_codon:yes stop_codon:yes gene_type:complete
MFQYFNEFSIIAIAHLIAVVSPGQDFALVIRQTIQYNRKIAIMSSIGIATGILIHIAYCILGVAFLFSNYEPLYNILKCICALYMLYLGCQSLFKDSKINDIEKQSKLLKKNSYLLAFKQGFLTNILNVKATLFFLSLYSFINVETPIIVQTLYGFWMCLITGLWFVLVSFFFTTKTIKDYTWKYNFILKKIMGIVLIYIAIKIFLYY